MGHLRGKRPPFSSDSLLACTTRVARDAEFRSVRPWRLGLILLHSSQVIITVVSWCLGSRSCFKGSQAIKSLATVSEGHSTNQPTAREITYETPPQGNFLRLAGPPHERCSALLGWGGWRGGTLERGQQSIPQCTKSWKVCRATQLKASTLKPMKPRHQSLNLANMGLGLEEAPLRVFVKSSFLRKGFRDMLLSRCQPWVYWAALFLDL